MKWFISLLSLSFMQVNANHPIFLKHKHIIDKANEISLYEIAPNPSAPDSQDTTKTYIENYEVLQTIVLKEDPTALQDAVLNTENYIEEKKLCPMQAKYALKFVRKHHHISLIMSENTCAKLIIFSSEEDINKQYHDMKEENSVFAILSKLSE